MVEIMQQEVIRAIKVAIGTTCYVTFTSNEDSTIDNQVANQS